MLSSFSLPFTPFLPLSLPERARGKDPVSCRYRVLTLFFSGGAYSPSSFASVSYTHLAYQAMTQGMDGMEDYYRMDGGIITVNTDTAAVLKADYSVFAQMAQLVEVTTTKD